MIRPLLVVVPMLALAACSGDRELRCESTDRYQSARSVQPVRVPDDLSVPDESGALLIFNVSGADELDRILAADPYYSHPAVHIGRRQEWSPIVGSPA